MTEGIVGIEKDIVIYEVQSEKHVDVPPSLTGGVVSVTVMFAGMTINGVDYTETKLVAKVLLECCQIITDKRCGNRLIYGF